MTPVEILTPVILVLAFVGYVWCLSRLFWVTALVTAGLGGFFWWQFPYEAAHLIYWSCAAGLTLVAVLVMLFARAQTSKRPEPAIPSKTKRRPARPGVVVDGTNVMYWDGEPDLRTLRQVVDVLRAKDLMPYVFFDASSRHHLRDKSLNQNGFATALDLPRDQITVCPAQTEADAFILKFAREHSLPVVSNDRFGDRAAQAKGLKRIKGVIAGGKPVLQGI